MRKLTLRRSDHQKRSLFALNAFSSSSIPPRAVREARRRIAGRSTRAHGIRAPQVAALLLRLYVYERRPPPPPPPPPAPPPPTSSQVYSVRPPRTRGADGQPCSAVVGEHAGQQPYGIRPPQAQGSGRNRAEDPQRWAATLQAIKAVSGTEADRPKDWAGLLPSLRIPQPKINAQPGLTYLSGPATAPRSHGPSVPAAA